MTSKGVQEKTFYNIQRLHWIFAFTSLLLLATTLGMLIQDHYRSWKQYQRRAAEIDIQTDRWLQQAALAQDDTQQWQRLERRIAQQRSTYFAPDAGFPWLGKRWLELPILDAFNSPRRIETLWAEDLTLDHHTHEVLRYDRCTTCHQRVQSGWPGNSDRPLFPPAQTLTLRLALPEDRVLPENNNNNDAGEPGDGDDDLQRIERALGMVVTESAVHSEGRMTVVAVAEGSAAAQARPPAAERPLQHQEEIEAMLLGAAPMGAGAMSHVSAEPAGLWMGDQILAWDGQPIRDRAEWAAALLAAWHGVPDADGQPPSAPSDGTKETSPKSAVTLTIRRGLEHPLAAHPRLDLFVGSSSPHPMSEFGCTVCHGGQGSATSFAWASHTPNDDADRSRWREQHGWFGNQFWPEPMLPTRFTESACLKCHHQVTDLAPSPRFPEASAAKLLRGYELVLQHGCYACHEITGFMDGRSVGPDLRVEPYELTKETEQPGTLRRPGPSLRHVASKLHPERIRRWVGNPAELQPESRMPRPFGNLDHVPESLRDAWTAREAIEILAAAQFLLDESQPLELQTPPAQDDQAATAEQRARRGRELFQTAGCLVCHQHRDHQDAEPFRGEPSVADGPDLSDWKDLVRGPDRRRWLYTWIKEPQRYDPRTLMPAMNPQMAVPADVEGSLRDTYDPVADLVEYLLGNEAEDEPTEPENPLDLQTLDLLVLEHLKREFPEHRAIEYRDGGIPMQLADAIKAAERDLLVTDQQRQQPDFRLDPATKLRYLGRKTVTWHGCYSCHEIAGFENLPPNGIELNSWGRKEPSMLAFGQVADYVAAQLERSSEPQPDGLFYLRHLRGENRIGFLHQKLLESRSFDVGTLADKPWNDRLRMPQYRFSADEREAVMTFVLGLVASPPRPRYVHQPDRQRLAVIEGRQILDQYNCRGCHMLRAPSWQIEFPPGTFDVQARQPTFPFITDRLPPEMFKDADQPDRRGLLKATLIGQPQISDDGRPIVYDDFGDELFDDETYDVSTLEYAVQLWEPTVLEGHEYRVGEAPLYLLDPMITSRLPSDGGFLTNYLLPHVVRRERETNPNAKGSEAWGWLPPSLHGLGRRVRTPWLRDYLLDPGRLRPAAVVQMPRYALSALEADRLARYFAAIDGVDERRELVPQRNTIYLDQADHAYRQVLQQAAGTEGSPPGTRLEHALQILADRNYCITCHIVGDYDPVTSDRAKAVDLASLHHRLNPDWLRRWIGNPVSLIPYTSMPVNIPFHPDQENQGGVDQALYRGTSQQQLDAVVDLLLNFDSFATSRTSVSDQIPAIPEAADP